MICAVTTMQHPAVTLTLKELKVDRLIKVESVLGFFALNFFVIKSILLRDGLHFNFHYPNYRYITSVLLLQAAGRQYSVSLWGSDYLKVTGWPQPKNNLNYR